MGKQWWYDQGGEKAGPIDEEALLALHREGKVSPNTLAWTQGQGDWAPLESVVHLYGVPPPLPPSSSHVPPPLAFPPAPAQPQSAAPRRGTVLPHPGSAPATQPVRSVAVGSPLASAWRRFFARCIDGLVFGYVAYASTLALFVAAGHVSPVPNPVSDGAGCFLWLFVAAPVLAFVLEAIWWAAFNKTPGKSVLGVHVLTLEGQVPDGAAYAWRQASAYAQAWLLSVPVIALAGLAFQGLRVSKGKATTYDSGEFQVLYQSRNVGAQDIGKVVGLVGLSLLLSILANVLGQPPEPPPSPQVTWIHPENRKSTQFSEDWKFSTAKEGGGWKVTFRHATLPLSAELLTGSDIEVPDKATRDIFSKVLAEEYEAVADLNQPFDSGAHGDFYVWGSTGPMKSGAGRMEQYIRSNSRAKNLWVVTTSDTLQTPLSKKALETLRDQLLLTQ